MSEPAAAVFDADREAAVVSERREPAAQPRAVAHFGPPERGRALAPGIAQT